uniref:Lysine rich coiled-coil 1 n=2 Tax=Canis lupus TaxID=9612 RepID=A0A8C0SRT7_CANLF
MENSKIYDSFQHELEDYVRKQKARGLQPEVCFRKMTEDSAYRERSHTAPKPLMLEQRPFFRRSHAFSSSHERQRTMENQLPPWFKFHHSRQRLESLNHYQEGRRRRSREEGREGRSKEGQVEGKTKHHEDGDSHKESKKARVQPVSTEKPKHRRKRHQDTTKEGRRSQREKKQPGKESTPERDLWDEAILGSCY